MKLLKLVFPTIFKNINLYDILYNNYVIQVDISDITIHIKQVLYVCLGEKN